MNITQRDIELLETLALRAPMLTVGQITDSWWPEARSQRPVRQRLKSLNKAGWIEQHIVNVRLPFARLRPLCAWKPGAEDPDPEQILSDAQTRWLHSARPVEVAVASARTACLFGSLACGLPPLEHRDHDLCLAAVYVHYRTAFPRLATLWIGHQARAKAGYRLKDPDALLLHGNGRVFRAIQVVGRWKTAQIDAFHEYCLDADLPYELW